MSGVEESWVKWFAEIVSRPPRCQSKVVKVIVVQRLEDRLRWSVDRLGSGQGASHRNLRGQRAMAGRPGKALVYEAALSESRVSLRGECKTHNCELL